MKYSKENKKKYFLVSRIIFPFKIMGKIIKTTQNLEVTLKGDS